MKLIEMLQGLRHIRTIMERLEPSQRLDPNMRAGMVDTYVARGALPMSSHQDVFMSYHPTHILTPPTPSCTTHGCWQLLVV